MIDQMIQFVLSAKDLAEAQDIEPPSRITLDFPTERDARRFVNQLDFSMSKLRWSQRNPAYYPFKDKTPRMEFLGVEVVVKVGIR